MIHGFQVPRVLPKAPNRTIVTARDGGEESGHFLSYDRNQSQDCA